MTALAIKKSLSMAFLWCKQHIEIFIGMAVVLVGMLFFARNQNVDLSKIMKAFSEKHAEERKVVEESYTTEETKITDASIKMKNDVVEAQKKHDEDIKELEAKKLSETMKLAGKSQEEITSALSKLTGFKIVEGGK